MTEEQEWNEMRIGLQHELITSAKKLLHNTGAAECRLPIGNRGFIRVVGNARQKLSTVISGDHSFVQGPYVVEGEIIAQAPDILGSVEVAYMADLGGRMTKDARHSTARLLAASPDLLAALEPFAKYACDLAPGEGCECNNCAARTAIAKANGESA